MLSGQMQHACVPRHLHVQMKTKLEPVLPISSETEEIP